MGETGNGEHNSKHPYGQLQTTDLHSLGQEVERPVPFAIVNPDGSTISQQVYEIKQTAFARQVSYM